MFTGLVLGTGSIAAIEPVAAGQRVTLSVPPSIAQELSIGASLAVDGACMTVVSLQAPAGPGEEVQQAWAVSIEVSPESLSRTIMGQYQVGSVVNLELPLQATDRLGGHFVSGHVDTMAQLSMAEQQGDYWRLQFALPSVKSPEGLAQDGRPWAAYLIEKGSITVNGISLTVNACDEWGFEVMIIPHTYTVTNLQALQPGSPVNLEFDLLGKYVAQLLRYSF